MKINGTTILSAPATTTNYVLKQSSTFGTLVNSQIFDNGTNVGIATVTPTQKLEVNGRTLVNEFQYTKGISIGDSDLNTISNAGFYMGSALTNAPDPSGWYYVTVERYTSDDWVHQTATSFGAGNTPNLIYSRVKVGGTWSAWKQITTSSDISGTTNYVSKFTGANSLGISLIFDNGTSVGIGINSPEVSALLDVSSTTQGFLPPRMRTSERDSINSPANGLIIFNTDSETIDVFTNGGGWKSLLF